MDSEMPRFGPIKSNVAESDWSGYSAILIGCPSVMNYTGVNRKQLLAQRRRDAAARALQEQLARPHFPVAPEDMPQPSKPALLDCDDAEVLSKYANKRTL